VSPNFVQPPLVFLRVNYWKKVWFPIQTPVFGDERGHSDGYGWRRSGQQCAGGSALCGGTPPTPQIAVSKWKLAILQVDFRPKVPFFLVFPYKTGIEIRKSATVQATHMGEVNREFIDIK
jgi:hypothetical protein